MCILFGVTLTEHFGTCGRTNRLQSHRELQGKEAVPSDSSPSIDVSQPALPPCISSQDLSGFFGLPPTYRQGDGVLLGTRTVPESDPAALSF